MSSSNNLDFHRAGLADANLLSELGARTFRDTYQAEIPKEDMQEYLSSQFSVSQIRAELEDPIATFLLAYDSETSIGYAKIKAGMAPGIKTGSNPVELERIYLDRNTIGKGYGSALLQACFEVSKAEGFETIWLGVWERNERAIHFYDRWGFKEAGCKTFNLGNEQHNDVIMARSLK